MKRENIKCFNAEKERFGIYAKMRFYRNYMGSDTLFNKSQYMNTENS